jgi:hypothetical protein
VISDDELAAVVAAIEVAWPQPVLLIDTQPPGPSPWRFSGRWWSRPQTARRERPWLPLSP